MVDEYGRVLVESSGYNCWRLQLTAFSQRLRAITSNILAFRWTKFGPSSYLKNFLALTDSLFVEFEDVKTLSPLHFHSFSQASERSLRLLIQNMLTFNFLTSVACKWWK